MSGPSYRYVARKISCAKWTPPAGWGERRASADAVTACLRTGNNRLSLWRLVDPTQDLGEVALAMVAASEKVETLDLVWLGLGTVEPYAIEETPGRTPVLDLQSRHVDLCSLDGRQLVGLADDVFLAVQAQSVQRYRVKDLLSLLREAVRAGRVSLETLSAKVKQELGAE